MQTEARTGISRSIVGVFDNSEQAHAALEQLRAEGVGPEEMSVMMRDTHISETVQEHASESPVAGGAATGAALGGLLGGLAGWMVAIGALAIPGVGLVVGAGALATTLAGIALGVATGGLIGGLLSLGVPEDDARQYESHLREGLILLTVHPSSDFDIGRATSIMEVNGGYDVRVYDTPPDRRTETTGPLMAEQVESAQPEAHVPGDEAAVDYGGPPVIEPVTSEVASQTASVPHVPEQDTVTIATSRSPQAGDAGTDVEVQKPVMAEESPQMAVEPPTMSEEPQMAAETHIAGEGTQMAVEPPTMSEEPQMAAQPPSTLAQPGEQIQPIEGSPEIEPPSPVQPSLEAAKTEEPSESVEELRKHYQPE